MTTQKENAETFVRIWKLDRSVDIAELYDGLPETSSETAMGVEREILESMQEAGIQFHTYRTEDRRRVEGEYGQLVLRRLRESLQPAYFTEPCKEFLEDIVKTNLADGRPSERTIPLRMLGIYPEEGRYDPYDPDADLREIDEMLLGFHNQAITQIVHPDRKVMRDMIDLNKRLNEAHIEKYRLRNPEATS